MISFKFDFDLENKLLALSWKQPFATLMLHNKIETRTWPTNYRGYVLICASKSKYSAQDVFNICGKKQMDRINNILKNQDQPTGVAIAVGELVDCRAMVHTDEDKCFVKYNPDLFCHIYKNVRKINPIPWKGTQGWKEVSEEVKEQIMFI